MTEPVFTARDGKGFIPGQEPAPAMRAPSARPDTVGCFLCGAPLPDDDAMLCTECIEETLQAQAGDVIP